MTDTPTWEQRYAKEHQLPVKGVEALCSRMRGEKDLMQFGTAANWAYKRKVKLSPRTTVVADDYFAYLKAEADKSAAPATKPKVEKK